MSRQNLYQRFALDFCIGEDGPFDAVDDFTIEDILSDQKKVLKGQYHSSERMATITLDCWYLHKYLMGHGFDDPAQWDQQDDKFCIALVKGINSYFRLNKKAYNYPDGLYWDEDDAEFYGSDPDSEENDPDWGVEPQMLYVGNPEDERMFECWEYE